MAAKLFAFDIKTAVRYLLVAAAFMLASPQYFNYATFTTQSLPLIVIVLCLAVLIRWRYLHPYFSQFYNVLRRSDSIPSSLFVGALFSVFVICAVSLSWYCFAFIPISCDGVAQYIHAKFMAAGHLYGNLHPLDMFFGSCWKIAIDGKWFTQYQPLSIFLLAIGHIVGMPWLMNPLEGALTLVAIYALTRRICDEATARLAAMLTLGCHWVMFSSTEYLNHSGALLFTTLFLLCYVETLETLKRNKKPQAYWWALGAGLCLGGVFLTRPFTSVEIAIPPFLYSLYLLWHSPRSYFAVFATMAVATLACLIFQGWYDLQTMGHIFSIPYGRTDSNNIGFGDGYNVWQGLVKAQDEWVGINITLFEWSVPSTIFVMFACLLPFNNPYLRLLLSVIISIFLLNMLNRLENVQFGPRYIYETTSSLIILTAVGISRITPVLASWRVTLPEKNALQGMIALIMIILFAGFFAYRLPEDVEGYHGAIKSSELYYSFLKQINTPALVFIEPMDNMAIDHTNPPRDDAPVIFAHDLGDENHKLIEYYPERNPYLERNGRLYPIDKTTFQSTAPQ